MRLLGAAQASRQPPSPNSGQGRHDEQVAVRLTLARCFSASAARMDSRRLSQPLIPGPELRNPRGRRAEEYRTAKTSVQAKKSVALRIPLHAGFGQDKSYELEDHPPGVGRDT